MTQEATVRAPAAPQTIGPVNGAREETSLLFFLTILLRNRRIIALCGLIGLIIFGAVALTEANLYVAAASFSARQPKQTAQLPGIVGQLGLSVVSGDAAQTLNLYAELARSNSILLPVAEKTYSVQTSKGVRTGPLATFYGIKAQSQTAAAMLAAKRLVDNVVVLTSSRSGIVTLLITDENPQIAAQIAMNILRELDAYSSSSHQEQAVAERKFTETLVAEARQKLDDAESRLAAFRQQNRDFQTSPQLRIRDDELTRDADLAQQSYAGIEASYEQARIEEVRNLSAIRVVEYPDVPVEPQRREAARQALLGLVAGLLAGIVIAFLRRRAEEKRIAADPTLDEYSDARRELSSDARRLLGPFARSSAES